MDYEKIGQEIRSHRKKNMLSQEQLAEMIGISVTHMSHIETGSTKLSLQVLVDLAKALQVSADTLLFGTPEISESRLNDLAEIQNGCTTREWMFLMDILQAAKMSMLKYNLPSGTAKE
ncbi:MAG: helix-turn-helix transcriptional regulator [Lachnospiraceae bacterium]|nr:helix-turn-helix transcriptional regulator [Lachnospiraceae bacterium]